MSLWKDILMLGAQGKSSDARALLALDLPLSLRELPQTARGSREYRGVLPQAIRKFCAKLPDHERVMVQSVEREFLDYLLDDIVSGVEDPLKLIELCRSYPIASLAELVDLFPWQEGLKRDRAWKGAWIEDHLRSFMIAQIPLPAEIVKTLGDKGRPRHQYNEIAFAVSPERMWMSWNDFKTKQEYDRLFYSVVEQGSGGGFAEEGFDYGVISIAERLLEEAAADDLELNLDLQILGQGLGAALTAKLEELHTNMPRDGYRPIAWHHVFWNLISDYLRLRLDLEVRDPYRETDQELADHIKTEYPEVKSASRVSILRRRKAFSAECERIIAEGFRNRFGSAAEQSGSRITHVVEKEFA
jgi:hypothetical protein